MKITIFSIIKLHLSKDLFIKDWRLDHKDQGEEGRVVGEWGDKQNEFEQRLELKQRSLRLYLALGVLLVVLGALIAKYVNATFSLSWETVRWIRAVSIVVIVWAVMGKLDDVKSMGGLTYLERASDYAFKLTYAIGVFLGGLSLFLVGVAGT